MLTAVFVTACVALSGSGTSIIGFGANAGAQTVASTQIDAEDEHKLTR